MSRCFFSPAVPLPEHFEESGESFADSSGWRENVAPETTTRRTTQHLQFYTILLAATPSTPAQGN
jgi:lipopolysaccharide biosynthesis protein